jgi:hypothetical protein
LTTTDTDVPESLANSAPPGASTAVQNLKIPSQEMTSRGHTIDGIRFEKLGLRDLDRTGTRGIKKKANTPERVTKRSEYRTNSGALPLAAHNIPMKSTENTDKGGYLNICVCTDGLSRTGRGTFPAPKEQKSAT